MALMHGLRIPLRAIIEADDPGMDIGKWIEVGEPKRKLPLSRELFCMQRILFEILICPQIRGGEVVQSGKQLANHCQHQQPGDGNERGDGGCDQGTAVV